MLWAKTPVLPVKECPCIGCVTPHRVALTLNQIFRGCDISALRFTFDGTRCFAATLSYPTIFPTFCLLFSSVWFPHRSKLGEFSVCFVSPSEGLEREPAAGEVFTGNCWLFQQTCWKSWDRCTRQSLSTSRADKNAHPLQTGCFIGTLKQRGLGNIPWQNAVLFLWERGKTAAKLTNPVVRDCNF